MSAVIDHETQQPVIAKTTTALAVVTKAVEEINALEAGFAALEQQYRGVVFDVGTSKGMGEACKARATIREPRYAIQSIQKETKSTLNDLKREVDSQATALIERISAIETPVHTQITNEEDRKRQEKEAKAAAERQRIVAIEERISDIRESVILAAGKSSVQIGSILTELVALVIDDTFAEFKQRAETAKEATIARLRAIHTSALAHEAEQAQLEAERERLAREKQEQGAAAANERERIAEEQRRQDEENERARQRNEMAMQEINAIHHQIIIADVGRAPYCNGGDLHSFDWVIEQTEQWPITEDKFGVLVGSAQRIKDSTLASLRKGRANLVQIQSDLVTAQAERDRLAQEKQEQEVVATRERARMEEENRQAKLKREAEEREHQEHLRRQRDEEEAKSAERRRILAEEERAAAERLAARKAESDRIDAERRAEREAEESRLAADRAEIERQQEALRVQQESVARPSDPVEATVAETVPVPEAIANEAASRKPSDEDIIHAVAVYFGETPDVASEWIAGMAICRGAA